MTQLTRMALAASLALLATAASAAPPSPAHGRDQCFDLTQRSNMLALNDHTLLVRVNGDIYRIETETCPALGRPDPRIDFVVEGSSYLCGKLDYRLNVGEAGLPGSVLPCIVRAQHRLTPAEVAAIPPNSRP